MITENKKALLNKKAFESLILRGVSFGLMFLMHMFLARRLGPEDYGIFSYTLSLSFVLSVFVGLGLPVASIRLISEYTEKKLWAFLSGVIYRTHSIVLFLSVAVTACLLLVHQNNIVPEATLQGVFYSAMLLPLLTLTELRNKCFLGLKCVAESIIFNDILIPVLVIGLLFCGVIVNIEILLRYYLFIVFMILVAGFFFLCNRLPDECKHIRPKYQTKKWLKIGFPLIFVGIGQVLLNRTSVLLLGNYCDMEDAGIYGLANRIAILNTFVMTSVNAIGAPMLASAYYGNDTIGFRKIFFKTMKWCALGALIPFMMMMLWPENLLCFFGEDFIQGKAILQILATGHFFNAITGLAGSALSMTGSEKLFGKITLYTALGNILLSFFIIPRWAGIGAAVVYSGSMVVMNSLLLYVVLKKMLFKYEL